MQSKKVRFITAFAAVACLLWLFGLGWTVNDYLFGTNGASAFPVSDEEPAPASDEFKIIALGDSLTRGIGDLEGKGYAGYVSDRLKQAGWNISFVNLGIKGLTSVQLAEQMKEMEIGRQIGQADAVLMTIGGNDLFLGGQTLSNLTDEGIAKLEDEYLNHLEVILGAIQASNPDAAVYVLGLYDPFGELEEGAVTSRVVRAWNYKTMETIAEYANAVFVPTYDLFQQNVSEYLFTDQFHPNEKGYQRMAERVAALIIGTGGQS
ncbi:GDSL-type esterase/lipase family protein [Paenibacillus alkaliterrae]|uniref:GDSL-type esterase/lipase family protein n=1 Tax=Paenibacillus alkaliterrae TaxID=320909 RepID=UPI001F463C0D|nr:GDSL-type esterase/lipase family protein [Paenibacillus alkaliterrae]MCF2937186.1 GDSL-type esterase/lipase family protein [Paenibacillus alkaliterrae]